MKLTTLLALAALMAVATGAGAQTKAPPMKPVAKKAMPMRDPKTGRFMKKSLPMRDPKTGRFIKKHPKGGTTVARDPKTGRFIKKG